MSWIRLAIAIAVFVMSCAGLGYLAGLSVRRLRWAGLVSGLMSVAIACLWPAIAVGWTLYSSREWLRQHPGDDAPGMVLMSVYSVGVPFLFFFSLLLALFGVAFARHRHSKQTACITTQGASE